MGKEVTIGGDRLGSGNKMTTELNHYMRSTHNLSEDFFSSIAPGVLYPFYKNIGLNGDSFEIDLAGAVRTLPTQGPLFGSFKLQADIFVCPIRLYQGILHNNPINIGMNMRNVLLPTMTLFDQYEDIDNIPKMGMASNSLVKYMGISGIGAPIDPAFENVKYYRDMQCVPEIAYYDIFKNYYANRMEENAYVITRMPEVGRGDIADFVFIDKGTQGYQQGQFVEMVSKGSFQARATQNTEYQMWSPDRIIVELRSYPTAEIEDKVIWKGVLTDMPKEIGYVYNIEDSSGETSPQLSTKFDIALDRNTFPNQWAKVTFFYNRRVIAKDVTLTSFPLENIDQLRKDILSHSDLGVAFDLNNLGNYMPYQSLFNTAENNGNFWKANNDPMNGLVIKTYQSDLFNNWLKTDFITGDNGITELTRIDTSEGLTMDALNFAQKIYNVLNRIVTAGGTFQDWQEAVYTDQVRYICETPEWKGGFSDEIVFDEVIQSSPTEDAPLGELGGRGHTAGRFKGGKLTFKITEPSYIIGIVSITPRIAYSQGNEWHRTEIKSIDDLHKPALDGIGFQELITEQMDWRDAKLDDAGTLERFSAGFVPAWLNYMTAIDHIYGDFAELEKAGFMVLDRNYGYKPFVSGESTIEDLTTYIDPTKYNYAFANASLTAQNFWLAMKVNIKARRLMSAKQIPNL